MALSEIENIKKILHRMKIQVDRMKHTIKHISTHTELEDQRQDRLKSRGEKQGNKLENLAKESMLHLNIILEFTQGIQFRSRILSFKGVVRGYSAANNFGKVRWSNFSSSRSHWCQPGYESLEGG